MQGTKFYHIYTYSPIARFTGVSLYDLDDEAKVVKQVGIGEKQGLKAKANI